MEQGLLVSLGRLSDSEIVTRAKSFAALERDATAQLVAHLVELERRGLHLRAGYGSLFVYCRDELMLSEHEAYNRIQAARAARRFPVILTMLAEGCVNLTTVRLLAPHLTHDNHQDVLVSARCKRKEQVEEIVARLLPRMDVPSSVRRLPAPSPVVSAAPPATAVPPAISLAANAGTPPSPVVYRGIATPLSPDRYKVQFTIPADTLEKLKLAKDMLRHAIPTGNDAAIFDRALTALLGDLARRKFAAADQPRPARTTTPGSRHIPAGVKRSVWLRDLGRCAFVGSTGRRCAERGFLEFHHLQPYALGGEASVANVQLRCRGHNAYEARVDFGFDGGRGGLMREPAAPYDARAATRSGTSSARSPRASLRTRRDRRCESWAGS